MPIPRFTIVTPVPSTSRTGGYDIVQTKVVMAEDVDKLEAQLAAYLGGARQAFEASLRRRSDVLGTIEAALADWDELHQKYPEPFQSFWVAFQDGWRLSRAVPDGILSRIEAALQRIKNGHGLCRVPADPTDVDLVLAECRSVFEGKWPPFWLKPTQSKPTNGEANESDH